jgi:branched-chain amino acid aminotransferase
VLGLYEAAKKSCDILSNIKHNNYLPYVLAALHAKKEKWNDAIVLNSHDRICDSTIANIFLIKDEGLFTPSLKEGCVAGVMRNKLIHELKATGWRVTENEISIEQVMNADELFLSNSIYNIRWVKNIGDKMYGNTLTQKIYAAVVSTI